MQAHSSERWGGGGGGGGGVGEQREGMGDTHGDGWEGGGGGGGMRKGGGKGGLNVQLCHAKASYKAFGSS